MHLFEAIETILHDAGKPLHYREISERLLKRGLWTSQAGTPEKGVNARLAVDIQKKGAESRFERVEPGVFGLRVASRPSKAFSPRPPKTQHSGKLGVQEIRSLARQLVNAHPEGIRYSQLLGLILDKYPDTPQNTIQGTIWNLPQQFPGEIHKPSRGVFKPGPANKAPEPPPPVRGRLREEMFYEAFADCLVKDLEDATEAVSLGGAGLRSKWSTPDVIGVYRPLPSDRIKFSHEIISAEIKIDPQTPVVAFGQAVAYRLFSTKTYIVMPKTISREDLDRLEALCMLFGVGLVLFSLSPQKPDFQIRMRAQRFAPDMYFVNEFAEGLHRLNRNLFNQLFQ